MDGPQNQEGMPMISHLRKNPLLLWGVILLSVLLALAILVPLCSPYTYEAQNVDAQNLRASSAHLFGTDKFGRDIFVRVWSGTRISLLVGFCCAFICGIVGVLIGSIAGYNGSRMDMVLMRLADIIDAIPSLLYVILIMLALGANVGSILLGICISGWIDLARLVRGEVKRLKNRAYCTAARMSGAGAPRVLFRHVLPNAAGPVIVNLTFLIPKAIFTETFLSFLGVGIAAPAASLGTLIQEARSQMQVYPSQMLFPIIVLCMLMLSINLIGAGLESKIRVEKKGQ